MGKKNKNLLSFPEDGYTITFDVKNNPNLKSFYTQLEKLLIKMNAKIYLADIDKLSGQMTPKNVIECIIKYN